jgi:hypothetical protein
MAGCLVVVAVAATSPRSNAAPLFAAPYPAFSTGAVPCAVAIVDLNGDGKPDLAVTNANSSTVSVLLGNGDGTFGARTDFGTSASPYSVAIGDFNADGKPDLAVVNQSSRTVSILLGNGDGSFGAKTDFDTGFSPRSVAIGDFNGDGKLDLAVANYGSHTVSVLLGNGDGSFAAKTDYRVGYSPMALAAGDLNADGKPDLAVANYHSFTVSVLLGNGDGSFGANTEYAAGVYPWALAIGDLNADGRPDLAVVNIVLCCGNGTASVLLGNGDGTFAARTEFGAGPWPYGVAIADLDRDGKPDLAVQNEADGTVSVLLGNGDGSFGVKTDYGDGLIGGLSLAVGDLNGDGWPDLVVPDGVDSVFVVLNQLGSTLGAGQEPAVTRFALAPARPNPFRSSVAFDLAVPASAFARLEIYDVGGRRVRTLQNGILAPGHHTRAWDGLTASGTPARTGVYFARFAAAGVELTRKALLVR